MSPICLHLCYPHLSPYKPLNGHTVKGYAIFLKLIFFGTPWRSTYSLRGSVCNKGNCQARVQVQALSQFSKRPGPGTWSYYCNVTTTTHKTFQSRITLKSLINSLTPPNHTKWYQTRVSRSKGPKDQDISKSHSNTSLTLKKVHLVLSSYHWSLFWDTMYSIHSIPSLPSFPFIAFNVCQCPLMHAEGRTMSFTSLFIECFPSFEMIFATN